MGKKFKGYVVLVAGKFLTDKDDNSGRPKLTRLLSRATVYMNWGDAIAAQDRLRGDQAANTSIVRR